MSDWMLWGIFAVVVVTMMVIDLGVLNRRAHVIKIKEAAVTSAIWIGLALVFNVFVFVTRGTERGLEFLTGYLIEEALSVDNLFVFLVIFTYFRVGAEVQHRVLFWGIVGVIVMRGTLIAIGAALIHQFEWILYFFGAFLIYTAYKLATQKESGVHPEKNPVVNFFRRFAPVTGEYVGNKFFTRVDGILMATPLFIVLLVVETTDLVFALDSIPAIFAVTVDPFIVFTSNIFAVLGLRALFFLLAGVLGIFRYLKYGLSAVLGFIGAKMLLPLVEITIPIGLSLTVVASILAIAIAASVIAARREGTLKLRTLDEAARELDGLVHEEA